MRHCQPSQLKTNLKFQPFQTAVAAEVPDVADEVEGIGEVVVASNNNLRLDKSLEVPGTPQDHLIRPVIAISDTETRLGTACLPSPVPGPRRLCRNHRTVTSLQNRRKIKKLTTTTCSQL